MNSDFSFSLRQSHDNLHIAAKGVFDGDSADTLIGVLTENYTGKGRIFVDTRGLSEVEPHGSRLFQHSLAQTSINMKNLFFKGAQGFALAPDGSRVLVFAESTADPEKDGRGNRKKREHHCCGKCEHCTCKGHHAQ